METNKLQVIFLFTTILFSTMAQEITTPKSNLEQLIQTIESKYAPDKRVEIFSIDAIESDKELVLKGETTNLLGYKELITEVKKTAPLIKDSIRLLPDEAIGEARWGIIYNSVANVHSQPTFSSEMVSQVLMGMPVKVLDKSDSWLRIQTPEGYIGWISGSVHRLNEAELKEYMATPKIIVNAHYAKSYSKPTTQSQTVSDIVVGNMLNMKGVDGDFYSVAYPDGRKAFVEKQNAQKVDKWLKEIDLTGESIAETAKQLMGVPYVWGGTSSKGLDCSGFTKTVYWLHGIVIARDASQQIKSGVEIDRIGNFENVQKGDLLFFGVKATTENPKERVVHVGIYIGNQQFIHASDYIHIGSFDAESQLYDEYNKKRYLCTMRYIGSENTQGITSIVQHPFYNNPQKTH